MLQIPSKIKSETCGEAEKNKKSWNPHCDQNRLRTSTESFPLCARWCLQPPCLCIGGVLRWGQHPKEHFRIKKSTRAVVLRLATIARFFKVPDLRRPHDFVSKLLSPHLKVLGKRRLPAAVAQRRMLCFHIIPSSTEEKRKENKNVRCPNNSRGSWRWRIEEGNEAK